MKKKRINRWLSIIVSLPKTLIFNIRTFGKEGLKLPVLLSCRTKVLSTYRGAIRIEGPVRRFMMSFGSGGSDGVVSNHRSELCLEKGSVMIISEGAHFAEGCSIRNSGTLTLGKRFSMNKNCFISCYKSVSIGDNTTAGWNVNIRDSDGHTILKDGVKKPLVAPVVIGNHVWLCSYADILKGCEIGNDCVVSYRSLVTKKFDRDHVMIGGAPAGIIQENIDWEF